MRPSSTFSSETLQLAGFRPWGLFAALLICLAFEVGVARQGRIWTAVHNSPTGLVAVQDRIAERMESPLVVVLGNSRMIDAVRPAQLDRELGLPPQSSYNLSLQAGRPFDFLTFYTRHRSRLAEAELLLVGLDDQMFSQRMDTAEQRFRFLSTLEQRWRYKGQKRLSFIAGSFVRSLDLGGSLWSMGRNALRRRTEVALTDDLRIRMASPRRQGAAQIPQSEIDRIVDLYYSRWALSPSQVEYLEELVELCREDGVAVLFLRPPARDGYFERARQLEPVRFARAMATYDSLPVAPLLFESASELALRPEDFTDYGHFSDSGGAVFTRAMADVIRRALPGLAPAGAVRRPNRSP